MRGKVETKPAASEAVSDVAANPNNDDAKAAMQLQLKKLLSEDPALAASISTFWLKARDAGITTTVVGDRAVVAGGNITSSTIITGDQNTVESQAKSQTDD